MARSARVGGIEMLCDRMPWEAFVTLQDDDLRAIYRYIKTVPAVHNAVVTMRKTS